MEIQSYLIQIAEDIGILKTDLRAVKDDLSEVKGYQEKQNGRVFQLADRVNALTAHATAAEVTIALVKPLQDELGKLKTDLATRDAVQKTNASWQAAVWACVGSAMTFGAKALYGYIIR